MVSWTHGLLNKIKKKLNKKLNKVLNFRKIEL